MKWNIILAKSINDGTAVKLLTDTSEEMQTLIDCVKDMDPEVYWKFKSAVFKTVNGSVNNGFDIDDDTYNIL